MICPKCGKSMIMGAIGSNAKGSLFWAKNEYFQNKMCNLISERGAIKNGGMRIPVGNGMTNERTKAWACEECKLVLIDCN